VLEYRGRLDTQVKLRGYRIELGEIEAHLQQQPSVAQSAVIVREDRPGDRRLVAYVVAAPGAPPDPVALRDALKAVLPDYMVPAAVVALDALPLTPNGKVDRLALPASGDAVAATDHVAPRDDYEIPLVAIFERVLGVAGVGVTDSFFDLGGHSLLAVRLITQVESTFGRNLPLATLFEAPTVAEFAAVLRREGWAPPWNSLVALQPRGTMPPFFCVHSLGANLVSYRRLATLIGDDQPFYGLQPYGLDGESAPHDSVEAMAAHYIREIQTVQPHGPYRLGGVCLGGIVAFEMAQQLSAAGEEVALVAMIDSYFPGVPPHQRPDVQRRWGLTATADYYLGDVLLRSPRDRVDYVLTRIVNIGGRIRRGLRALVGRPVPVEGTLPQVLLRIRKAHSAAEHSYVPTRFPGHVQLFWCAELPVRAYADTRLGWSEFADEGLDVVVVPGNHLSMVEEPHVRVLATKLRDTLIRANRNAVKGPA
jgi:thioesterase domain-containing protein/acyl carrier protein